MQSARLRWGILSTARIADAVLHGIRASSNGDVVAVASRDADRAREWARARNIPQVFGSYDDLLASGEVDAVYVALPNSLHTEWTVKAANLGKHVLCEKPIAVNATEVEEIIAAAEANRVKVMEAFMYRFHPQTALIKQLLDGRAVGDIKILRASFGFFLRRPHDVRWDKALGGGALFDVGSYCVNLSNFVAGSAPTAVTASAVWSLEDVDLTLTGTLEYPGGILGTLDCSFQTGVVAQQWFGVSGTEGLLGVQTPFSIPDGVTTIRVDKADGETPPEEVRVPAANKYHLMVEDFADAVLNDRPVGFSLRESLANTQTIDALFESARTGRRVELPRVG